MKQKVRDSVVEQIELFRRISNLTVDELLSSIALRRNRYYEWKRRYGRSDRHNGHIPKGHYTTPAEKQAVLDYARSFDLQPGEYVRQGYRRLCYEMIDKDIVYLKPSTVYRILKKAGLVNQWKKKEKSKGNGFKQPKKPHSHWHIDIKYLNFHGTFLFLISVIDGFSRFIVHHEIFREMTDRKVSITLQGAHEKFKDERPRVISDNGGQFVSKDFKIFIKQIELSHVRTSPYYPQSNGKIERFHRTIGIECLQVNSFITEEEMKEIIARYIEYYNYRRLHSAIQYLPPASYLDGSYVEKLKIRKNKIEKGEMQRAEYWQTKSA